jgi:hypothetical protein
MPNRLASLAKSQRYSSPSDGGSGPKRGGDPLAVRHDTSRTLAPPPVVVSSRGGPLIPASLRHYMICEAAYFRAQARGLVPGREIEDWLAAEQDIEELIVRRYGR